MGYTHYWTRPIEIPEKEWSALRRVVGEVLVRWPDGVTDADLDDDVIRFDGGCETFYFPRIEMHGYVPNGLLPSQSWSFCKTRQLPYDDAVVESLKAIRTILGDRIELSSDGDGVFDEEDA